MRPAETIDCVCGFKAKNYSGLRAHGRACSVVKRLLIQPSSFALPAPAPAPACLRSPEHLPAAQRSSSPHKLSVEINVDNNIGARLPKPIVSRSADINKSVVINNNSMFRNNLNLNLIDNYNLITECAIEDNDNSYLFNSKMSSERDESHDRSPSYQCSSEANIAVHPSPSSTISDNIRIVEAPGSLPPKLGVRLPKTEEAWGK